MSKTTKSISKFNVLLLVTQLIFSGFLWVALPEAEDAVAVDQLCPVAADVVFVMDRSGSMNYCEWWALECANPPSCSEGYGWVKHTSYNTTQSWCEARNQSAPHNSVWIGKMEAAQSAANYFLDLLGEGDRSALVSFATTASLDKGLSSDHDATKTAVDNIVVSGATNIGDAIDLGVQELKSDRAKPQANQVMILLTDGQANKPNGTGSGENEADVAYAIAKANEAAVYGYKIFTIGLGPDINETNETLQQIADNTGAEYYYSPSQDALENIYNSIALEICKYGSIFGCKWLDQNGDGVRQDDETEMVSGWEIILSGYADRTQDTDSDGCYRFSGLEPGSYVISEGTESGWTQTYPANPNYYEVVLTDWNEHKGGYDFGNFENSICDPQDTQGECVESGYRQHSYSYAYPSCGQDYTQNVADESCDCEVDSEAGECASEGFRQYSYSYNYDYCGGDYTEDVSDDSCDCVETEIDRQCVDSSQAEVFYSYNFEYCGQDYSQIEDDLECDSSYQCQDWSDGECTSDGVRQQSRICYDQYQNSYTDSRPVGDESCDCLSEEVSRQCVSDNGAEVTYSYNYDYCGEDYTEDASDDSCGCEAEEVSRACSGENEAQVSYSYNYDYCGQDYTETVIDNNCEGEAEPVCGNNIIETGEACDEGENNGAVCEPVYGGSCSYCSSQCSLVNVDGAYCGDGIINGSEECDDSNSADGDGCNATCQNENSGGGNGGGGSTGGGGSFISNPKVELGYDYVALKEVAGEYSESIIVKNTGNIILTNGVFEIDLAEENLEFISANPEWNILDQDLQTASWSIDALAVGAENTFEFVIKATSTGEPMTEVKIIFDQAEDSASFSEIVLEGEMDGVGGEMPEQDGTGNNGEIGMATVDENSGQSENGSGSSGGVAESSASGQNNMKDEDDSPAGEQTDSQLPISGQDDDGGVVAGAEDVGGKTCQGLPWWLLILILAVYVAALSLSREQMKDGLAKYRIYTYAGLTVVVILIIIALLKCWI